MNHIIRKSIPYGIGALVGIPVVALVHYGFDSSFWGAPVTTAGLTPFQMLQGLLIGLAGIVTLAMAYWRSETAHKQATAALNQIELNQEQIDQVARSRTSDQYQKALEMLAGQGSKELGRSSGVRMLQELVETNPDEFYQKVIHILMTFVTIQTHPAGREFGRALADHRNENLPGEPEWRNLDEMGQDVHNALDALFQLRTTEWARLHEEEHPNSIFFHEIALCNHTFERLNLSGISIEGGVIQKCKFIDCDLTGSLLLDLHGKDCELINCRVDGAEICLKGGWKIERNNHTEERPPISFQPNYHGYQDEIDEERQQLEEQFQNADDQMKEVIALQLHNLENVVPKLQVRVDD